MVTPWGKKKNFFTKFVIIFHVFGSFRWDRDMARMLLWVQGPNPPHPLNYSPIIFNYSPIIFIYVVFSLLESDLTVILSTLQHTPVSGVSPSYNLIKALQRQDHVSPILFSPHITVSDHIFLKTLLKCNTEVLLQQNCSWMQVCHRSNLHKQ